MNARRLIPATLATLATLCALAGGLALSSAPVFAEKIYVPGISFGQPGSDPGQLNGPVGVAVNDASPLLEPVAGGDVYVVDRGNNRVERFSATGEYEGQFNGSGEYETTVAGKLVKEMGAAAPTGSFSSPGAITVDDDDSSPSFGDVYVSYKGNDEYSLDQGGDKAVDRFSPSGEYLGQISEFTCPPADEGEPQNQSGREEEEEACPPGSHVPFDDKILAMVVNGSGDLWVDFEQFGEAKPFRGKPKAHYFGEFDPTGAFVKMVSTPNDEGFDPHLGMAMDSAGNVYIGRSELDSDGTVAKRDGAKLWERDWIDGESFSGQVVTALAVNPTTENLLVDNGGSLGLYGPFGEPFTITNSEHHDVKLHPLETFPNEGLSRSDGLAVNASGTAYASELEADEVKIFNYVPVPTVITGAPSEVTETGLTLHGSVNPEGEEVKECYFEYGTEAGKYSNRVECEPAAGEGTGHIGKGTAAVPVSAVVSGLEPAELRSFHLVAVSASGIPGLDSGSTISRPLITGEGNSGVGSTGTTLVAEVDPAGFETCYEIEYGTSTAYGQSVAGECVGAGEEDVSVSRELSGLRPDTAYHFRLLATNALGTTTGEDVVATTFPSGEGELPDGRVYELVSGSASEGAGHDANVYVPGSAGMLAPALDSGESTRAHGISSERPAQAAADGEAVAYVGDPPASGGDGSAGPGEGNQYVARRSVRGGWMQTPVNAPGFANRYAAFSGELSVGVLNTGEELAESAPAGYAELYSRVTTGGPFEPLFTATPENSSPGGFGYVDGDDQFTKSLGFAGANAGTVSVPAFSHLLFEADAALPSTPAVPGGAGGANNLYESVGGQLYLVNVLPNNRGVEPNATFGVQEGRFASGTEGRDARNAISADGSRIYWSAVKAVQTGASESELRAQRLYVRENATQPEGEGGECEPGKACTVQIDAAEAGLGVSGGGGQFVAASSDGSRVFFTDEKRLTSDSSAQAGAPDLYEYDLERPEEERLSDLSVPAKDIVCPFPPGACGHADVQGVLGTSEDGSYVYFVAGGVISKGKNVEGREPVQGQPNLYLRHEGATTFIVTLSGEDGDFTPGGGGTPYVGDWQGDPGHRTAEVSPDGRGVVFMSRLSLTSYDNVLDGVHLTEVFVYDAETGRIACASCNPSGEPPVAPPLPEYAKNIKGIWGSFIPVSSSLDAYQPRVISQGGLRVFFDSIEPLVPRDSNGYLDVYEWEQDGTGSCREAQSCVYLLSGGQDPENSYLLDASASGNDVFFVSRAQLTSEDRGGETEVLYDARVGGVVPPAEAKCSETGCQGVPLAPPIFATPASVTFAGTANFSPTPPEMVEKTTNKKTVRCPKGKKRGKHGKCVRAKGKQKATKPSRRAPR
jgi:hypothetical protein